MRYTVKVAVGNIRDRLVSFDGWRPGLALATDGPEMILRVQADSPEGAAEEAFAVGNRVTADADGYEWPDWVRSVSVADVILVVDDDGETAWAVRPVGWESVPVEDVRAVLREGREALVAIEGGRW